MFKALLENRIFLHLLFLSASSVVWAEEKLVDFNRDIRPILSDRCYKCHGPDAENQKSDFRLDSFESAIADLEGYAGVVPGDLKASEVHWRIWEEDPVDMMPPEKSKLFLNEEEKKLLDRWILEGAKYDEHWSFKPVAKPALPQPDNAWAKNGIDHFISERLTKEGLKTSSVAEKSQLLRRVSFDLTGLPPTLEETEDFMSDESPDAWERVVDRLLASPSYGERMALVWLDAARYADTGGYQNDIRRSQWPWRDWVIDAYNKNMPFDQFTVEQLAGDLLPEPSDSQRLATAFNRNHRINNEGGIIPEEFQVEYVADRAETTATVWMGLTLACARCHDHKYDPLTQKDFYEMFAFFNNVPENGRDGSIAPEPNMPVYTGGTKEKHEELRSLATASKKALNDYPKTHLAELEQWLREQSGVRAASLSGLTNLPLAQLHFTFDEMGQEVSDVRNPKRKGALNGRKKKGAVFKENTTFGNGVYLGESGYVKIPKPHEGGFDSSKPASWLVQLKTPDRFGGFEGPVLVVAEEDSQLGYRIMIEESGSASNRPPEALELAKESKAKTGKDKSKKPQRWYRISFQLMQNVREQNGLEVVSHPVVRSGAPARIGVTWDGSGKAAGVKLYLDGELLEAEVLTDQLDSVVQTSVPLLVGARNEKDAKKILRDSILRNGVIDDVQHYASLLDPEQMQTLSSTDPIDLLFVDLNEEGRKNLEFYWLKQEPEAVALAAQSKKDQSALRGYEKRAITEVSIMEEQPGLRETYLLERGVYDQPDKSEVLVPSPPNVLPAMDDSLPKDRLGLAKWIVDPKNPLTARVAVNRYWQMYFGRGLVKTSEDFGAQGEVPSHPQLLDWLASEFVASGWDIKAMQKLIVMSATYQQSSRVTPELLEKDPENRLLARGPRYRLSGQALRDQVLAVSGLLAPQIGGSPVMPYQPKGLWDELNAKFPYVTGTGDDLYRRSLYTFWRRTIPPPSMMNFDNASREICSVKSTRTNTPLQAMNLLNDPQFFEAARGLAQRMLLEGGESIEEQITFGHKVVLARNPTEDVLGILEQGYQEYFETFSTRPERVTELLKVGYLEADPSLNPIELAAMTAVANIFLNLDETVTKE